MSWSFRAWSFRAKSFVAWSIAGVAIVGGRVPGGQRKKVYVEWQGRIYLFDNAAQAATWLQHQKWLERQDASSVTVEDAEAAAAQPDTKTPRKRRKPLPEPEIIDLAAIGARIERYETGVDMATLQRLMESQQWDQLQALQKRIQDAEDEEIILLLVAAL